MGETDGTKQGTGTNATGQEASQAQKSTASKVKEGSTSQEQATKTFTEAEAQKMVSDRLAQAGRTATALEKREAAVKEAETAWRAKQDEDQRRRDEEEEEKARDNPDLLSTYQLKRKNRDEAVRLAQERADFEKERQSHQEEIESAAEIRREIDIFDISQEYEGADPMKLKTLCETFKTTSKEQIRQAADTIWAKKAAGTNEAAKIPRGDSGRTIGGENTDDLTPREKIEKGLEKAKRK